MSEAASSVQPIGLALVVLGATFAAGWAVRNTVRVFGALYIPVSVVTGFLILLMGPQVLGKVFGTQGLFAESTISIWRALPGLLITVVFASIMIGKSLPNPKDLWHRSAPHFVFGSFLSFGQFFLGGVAVLLLLGPVFGVAPEAGSLLEMSFAGGHGTIAGMGQLLDESGAGDLVDVGLGLATISMVTGIVIGTLLVRWAVVNPDLTVAREQPPHLADDIHVDDLRVMAAEEGDTSDHGIHDLVFSAMLVAVAILISVWLLQGARWVMHHLGSDILDSFPLFPVAVIGGYLVQVAASRCGFAPRINRAAVSGIAAVALDGLVACAIGTMSLAAIGSNVPAVVAFTVIGVVWSVVALLWFGPRVHPRNWFEHGIADFGQSQGNVATGFVLADMVDPRGVTGAQNDYGYKQLLYEPILGGGVLTALSVPLITDYGLVGFTVVSGIITVALGIWGVRRTRTLRAGSAG